MRKRISKVAALAAAMALMVAGPAYGVGGPNEAGNSGKFQPKTAPCQSDNNHPHCPGPH